MGNFLVLDQGTPNSDTNEQKVQIFLENFLVVPLCLSNTRIWTHLERDSYVMANWLDGDMNLYTMKVVTSMFSVVYSYPTAKNRSTVTPLAELEHGVACCDSPHTQTVPGERSVFE